MKVRTKTKESGPGNLAYRRCVEPWAPIGENILYGLARVRPRIGADGVFQFPHETVKGKPGRTRLTIELSDDEEIRFRRACELIWNQSRRAVIDPHELADGVHAALIAGSRLAAAERAKTSGPLSPTKRDEYLKFAQQAQGLAQWIGKELVEREEPKWTDDGVMWHRFPEGDYRNPSAFADLLLPRAWAPVKATLSGATIGPSAFADHLKRAVDTINNLHWLAGLLRAECPRRDGRALADWKPTALALKQLFKSRLGKPMLFVVSALAGIAHRCEVPIEGVSRLSKP